jgi:hypothetical protein
MSYNMMIGYDIYDSFTMQHFRLRQRMTLTIKIYCSRLYTRGHPKVHDSWCRLPNFSLDLKGDLSSGVCAECIFLTTNVCFV